MIKPLRTDRALNSAFGRELARTKRFCTAAYSSGGRKIFLHAELAGEGLRALERVQRLRVEYDDTGIRLTPELAALHAAVLTTVSLTMPWLNFGAAGAVDRAEYSLRTFRGSFGPDTDLNTHLCGIACNTLWDFYTKHIDDEALNRLSNSMAIVTEPFGSLHNLFELQELVGHQELSFSVIREFPMAPPLLVASKGAVGNAPVRLLRSATSVMRSHGYSTPLEIKDADNELAKIASAHYLTDDLIIAFNADGSAELAYSGPEDDGYSITCGQTLIENILTKAGLIRDPHAAVLYIKSIRGK